MGFLASIFGGFSPAVCLGQGRRCPQAPCLLFLQPLGVLGYFQHFPLRLLCSSGWHRGQDLRPPYPSSSDLLGHSCSCGPPSSERAGQFSSCLQSPLRFPGALVNVRLLGPSGTGQAELNSSMVRDRHWGREAGQKAPPKPLQREPSHILSHPRILAPEVRG